MSQQCPLLFRKVDATVTRINTVFVISGVIAFLFTQCGAILLFLIADFILRLAGYKHVSPTQRASLWIQQKLSFPPKMEDAGAKRLAALFGVGFLISMGGASWMGWESALMAIAAIYLTCAVLDVAVGFCVACHIYAIAKKIYPKGFE
jgi:hypothetical protein